MRAHGRRARGLLAMLLPLVAAAGTLTAQDPLSRAFDLERRGSYAQAADIYRTVLRDQPGEVTALLGLERALMPLNRVAELLPAVQAALAAAPGSVPVYGVGLRAYAALNMMDSLPRLVDAWSKVAPRDETPYREWASVALQRRDRATARRAFQLARERLGEPEALAAELAQLATAEEDWPVAVREWLRAVRQLPGYRSSATTGLGQAPVRARPDILTALGREAGPDAARMSVDLRARWGDPLGAYEALTALLTGPLPKQVDLLQTFLELVRLESTPPYLKAQARTLEELANRWVNAPQRARYRLEAARAYADAGERPAARRMLTQIAGDSSSGAPVAAGATATLIDLLVLEGSTAEASTQLDRYRAVLAVDEYLRLRRAVAAGWARAGDVARGEAMLAADSSVEALALSGRFRLYAGDLKGAADRWKAAGPFAGSRGESTERSALLALIQPIGVDTLPALGAALRTLDAGDSTGAARAIEQIAGGLPPDGGRADLRLFAGRLYAGARQPADAERVLQQAVVKDVPSTAAAALLELGRLYLAADRGPEAVAALEQMILEYPGSALLPQGRRLLDQARNAVPRT